MGARKDKAESRRLISVCVLSITWSTEDDRSRLEEQEGQLAERQLERGGRDKTGREAACREAGTVRGRRVKAGGRFVGRGDDSWTTGCGGRRTARERPLSRDGVCRRQRIRDLNPAGVPPTA